jgi:hypothetical protein
MRSLWSWEPSASPVLGLRNRPPGRRKGQGLRSEGELNLLPELLSNAEIASHYGVSHVRRRSRSVERKLPMTLAGLIGLQAQLTAQVG